MKNKEALELALMMLERDNLKVANIYVNYDIQKALIKLVKKKLEKKSKKKEWVGLTDEEYQAIRYGYDENGERNVEYELFDEGEYGMEVNIYVDDFARAIEAKLKEKNT